MEEDEEQERNIQLTFIYRKQEIRVQLSLSCTLGELGEQLRSLSGIAPHTMRLLPPLTHRSFASALLPFSPHHAPITLLAAGITPDLVLRMMGSSPEELEEMRGQHEEGTIIGFIEEERRAKRRSAPINNLSQKLPQGSYIFSDFKTLELPGIELNPPPNKALEIMHKLASDRGIVSIMNKHQWRVGLMTEMAPIGYVGISPKCVLGLNKNHGEEISLRLRTDDLKGFRKYESIKKTLLHELAHMVYSEHDADFYALDRQLNEESVALDWTKPKGHTWGGLDHYEEDAGDAAVVEVGSSNTGYKVGGSTETLNSSAQSAAAYAALRRLENASRMVKENENHEVLSNGTGNQPKNQSTLVGERRFQTDGDHLQSVGRLLSKGDNEALEHEGNFGVLFKKRDENGEKQSNLDDFHNATNLDSADHESNSEGMHHLGVSIEVDAQSKTLSQTLKVESDSHSNVEGQGVLTAAYLNEGAMKNEPDPDDPTSERRRGEHPSSVPNTVDEVVTSKTNASSPVTHNEGILIGPDNLDLGVIQEPGEMIWNRLGQAIAKLKEEAGPSEATASLQTLLKILRNVMEHPHEAKFKRLRKANPLFQSRVAKFKGALEVLHTVGFSEQSSGVLEDDFLILKRNDPGLLWLARSSLETCLA